MSLPDHMKANFFTALCWYLESKGKIAPDQCGDSLDFDRDCNITKWTFSITAPTPHQLSLVTLQQLRTYEIKKKLQKDKSYMIMKYMMNSRLANALNQVTDDEVANYVYNNCTYSPF